MVVNNFQMLRNQRLRDQPTSVFGMQRVARNIGQQPGPQTNTNVMTPPPVVGGNNVKSFPALPGQQAATGIGNFRPPMSTNQLARPSQPGSGTGWQGGGGPNTLANAAGGRFYQDGTTWYSNSPMNQMAHMNQGGPQVTNMPQQPGQQPTGTLAQRPQFGVGTVQAITPTATLYPQGGQRGSGDNQSTHNPTTQRQAVTSTGTSSSGLAPAGTTTASDNVGNPVNLGAEQVTQAGFNVESDGTITDSNQPPGTHGNINDPGSWDSSVKQAIDYINDGGGFNTPGANHQQPTQQTQQDTQTPSTIDDWLKKYGLGQPPQFDQGAVTKLNDANRMARSREQGRGLQAQSEIMSRAGASADQSAGAMGDVTSAYGLQGAQEEARNNLQAKVQNFQQQADYYNKQFQIGMSLFADAQSDQDREKAFQYAQSMLKLGTEAQKGLIQYQNDLQNQVSWKDVLGMLLGAGTQVGSAAAGNFAGGGGMRGY